MHEITFVRVLSTNKQPFVTLIRAPGLRGLSGRHVRLLVEVDPLSAIVITRVLDKMKNKQLLVTITVVAMVLGRHGLSVLLHAMVAPNSEPDHMTAAWPMISKLLSVGRLVLTLCGHSGQDVLFATTLASHQSWPSVHADTLAQLNKTFKRRHVLHHAVLTGLSGDDGDHARLHVVTDLEPESGLVSDPINSVRL